MEWKLYDIDGNFIQEVNCQYDSLDFGTYFGGSKIMVDFNNKIATIIEKDQQFNNHTEDDDDED